MRITFRRDPPGTRYLLARNLLGAACIPAAITATTLSPWFWLAIPALWLTDRAVASRARAQDSPAAPAPHKNKDTETPRMKEHQLPPDAQKPIAACTGEDTAAAIQAAAEAIHGMQCSGAPCESPAGHAEAVEECKGLARQALEAAAEIASLIARPAESPAQQASLALAIAPARPEDARLLAEIFGHVASHGWDAGEAASVKSILHRPGTTVSLLRAKPETTSWPLKARPGKETTP